MPYLASLKHWRAQASPFSVPGNKHSSGKKQSSKKSSPVEEARIESLCLLSCVEKPGVFFSMTNPRMPSSVLAQTIAKSAIGALVIQALLPDSVKPPATFLAWVFIEEGSEPAF